MSKPIHARTRTEKARAASLDAMVRDRGGKFKSYWSVIRKLEGADSGSEWMAIHIGMLNERVDNLNRRLRRVERKRPNDALRDSPPKI